MQTENDTSKHEDSPQQEDGEGCQERLVRLLRCPFCDSEAEITDESQPDRPQSWFFAWCKNRDECNAWLAASTPKKAAQKWNRRAERMMEAWRQRALKLERESLKWTDKKPSIVGWWWEWTGDIADAPEIVCVVSTDPLMGFYRNQEERQPLDGGPFYAGPIPLPNVIALATQPAPQMPESKNELERG